MPDQISGVSVPSRNVFDALIEWNEQMEAKYGTLFGLQEYIYAVEGVVIDFDDSSLMDELAKYLWHLLDVVMDTEQAAVEANQSLAYRELMLALLHTALIRILHSGRNGVTNLPGSDGGTSRKIASHAQHIDLIIKEYEFLSSSIDTLHATIELGARQVGQFENSKTSGSYEYNKYDHRKAVRRLEKAKKDLVTAEQRRTAVASERVSVRRKWSALVIKRFVSIQRDKAITWPSPSDVQSLVSTFLYSKSHFENLTSSLQSAGFPERLTGHTRPSPTASTQHEVAKTIVWAMQITFLGSEPRATTFGKLIWTLGECLETIPGVVVAVELVGTGSLWVKLKIMISNIWASDDVKEVLLKAREGIVAAKLDRPVNEINKLRAETEKLREEAKKTESERSLLPNAELMQQLKVQELRRAVLENEDRLLSLERKEIENRMAALQFIEKASQLIRDGIVQADPVQIDINGLMFLLMKDGKVKAGASLEDIEGAGTAESR